ncbi:hypothetical protein, partial [Marinobacter sp. X15-166B]|uniref:hypothetical protein n=1 Tax=Marinobacter sp. X15-166B TaxID=1897620 RepID=UPI0009F2482E
MKKLITISLGVLIGACSLPQQTVNVIDVDSVVVGEKPGGYPKVYIKALPDRLGFCIKVTDDWAPQVYQGQTYWVRDQTVES